MRHSLKTSPSVRDGATRKRTVSMALATLLLLGLGVTAGPRALAVGTLVEDVTAPFGKFNGVQYVKHTGRLVDTAGNYRVPYEIVAPDNSRQGNGAIVVELSHFWLRTEARDYLLGQDFLFGQGYSYAAVGWGDYMFGPWDFTILDPTATDVFAPFGVGGVILGDFGNALRGEPFGIQAGTLCSFGYSQTSGPQMELLLSDQGAGVFDFSMTGGLGPAGTPYRFIPNDRGRVMELRPEGDVVLMQGQVLRGDDTLHPLFRIYELAGMPHVPAMIDKDGFGNSVGYVIPQLDWTPFARSLLRAGHLWATEGQEPPASVYLESVAPGSVDPVYGFTTGIARDAGGNALGGVRSPDLELGRGQFLAAGPVAAPGLFGLFDDWKDTAEFRAAYPNHGSYVSAFEQQLSLLSGQNFLVQEDAVALLQGVVHSEVGK